MAMTVVETRNLDGRSTALGIAGTFTAVIDRPSEQGGGGLGFNGGQLLYLAVAACVSNDLFRESERLGIRLSRVEVRVQGEFAGRAAVSGEITYDVELSGSVSEEQLRSLLKEVDSIAEIPNTLRRGVNVKLANAVVTADN